MFTFRNLSRAFLALRAINAVKGFITDLITQADQLKHNAEMLGVTTEELQKFQYVAGIMQVPVQQTAVALRFFNRAIGEASFGTKSASKAFAHIGVAVKDANGEVKPTSDLLFEVADKLKGVHSQAQRTALAMRFFGRSGAAMLPVLQKGGAALKEAFKDVDDLGGGFNDKFIEAAHATDVQLKRLKMGWRSVAVAIATEVLPWLNKNIEASIRTVKHLIDLAKHTYFFRTALATLAGGTLFFALYRLFKLFKIGSMSVRDWLTAFVKYPMIMLVTAALVGLYLAIDDLYTFLKGGKSVIGDFLDHFYGFGTAADTAKELASALGDVWEALKPVGQALKPIVEDIGKAFIKTLPNIVSFGLAISTYIVAGIDSVIFGLRRIPLAFKDLLHTIGLGPGITQEEYQKDLGLIAGRNKRLEDYKNVLDVADKLGRKPEPARAGAAPGNDYGPQPPGVSNMAPDTLIIPSVTITNNISGVSNPREAGQHAGQATKKAVKDVVTRHRDAYNAVGVGQPITGQ